MNEHTQHKHNNQDVTSTIMITPSEIMEYLYCPRFTFFLNVLRISQHEERRFKVMKGREVHEQRGKENRAYIRKKIPMTSKEINVYLASPSLQVRGIIDEVLHLKDGSLAPLDYKFSVFNQKLYNTYKIQLTLYALLIEETYQKNVTQGYIAYVRKGSHVETVEISEHYRKKAKKIVSEVLTIIEKEIYPKATPDKRKCVDCTYKNICSQ